MSRFLLTRLRFAHPDRGTSRCAERALRNVNTTSLATTHHAHPVRRHFRLPPAASRWVLAPPGPRLRASTLETCGCRACAWLLFCARFVIMYLCQQKSECDHPELMLLCCIHTYDIDKLVHRSLRVQCGVPYHNISLLAQELRIIVLIYVARPLMELISIFRHHIRPCDNQYYFCQQIRDRRVGPSSLPAMHCSAHQRSSQLIDDS